MHFTKNLPLKQGPNPLAKTPFSVSVWRFHNTRQQLIDTRLAHPLVPVSIFGA